MKKAVTIILVLFFVVNGGISFFLVNNFKSSPSTSSQVNSPIKAKANLARTDDSNQGLDITTSGSWYPQVTSVTPYTTFEQKLTKNYYFIIDMSGSMDALGCSGGKTKANATKSVLEAVLPKLQSPSTHIGMAVFDEKGLREVLPLAPHTSKIKAIKDLRPGGETPLKDAVNLGISKLGHAAYAQSGYGEYNLVIITDGEASPNQDPRPSVDRTLIKTPIQIKTIGFCIGYDHSLNQPNRTEYYATSSVNELTESLEKALLAESPEFNTTFTE